MDGLLGGRTDEGRQPMIDGWTAEGGDGRTYGWTE